MAADARAEIIFADRFDHGTDGQWRVQVPSKWRPHDGQERYFVQLIEHDVGGEFLRVLPFSEAIRLRDTLSRKSDDDPAIEDEKRRSASEMEMVDLDKAGRITLPTDKAQAAGIGQNEAVVLAGCWSYFQIWNQARYEKVRAADAAAKKAAKNKKT